jgi:hypothetical protein
MTDDRCMFCLGPCDNNTLLSPICKCPALYHDYCGEQWYTSYKDTCPICRKVVPGGKPTIRVVPVSKPTIRVVPVSKPTPRVVTKPIAKKQKTVQRPIEIPPEQLVSIEEYVIIESVPTQPQTQNQNQPKKLWKLIPVMLCIALGFFGFYMYIHNRMS